MANPVMNTYAQVGKVEEVSDEISMISPTNTPFLTLIGSDPIDNTFFQWLEDNLDAPASNAAVEGADAPAANQVPPVTRTGTTQILTKSVSTAGSADKMKLHGKPGVEFARQMAKKAKEIKRDLEYAMVGTRQAGTTGNATTARTLTSAQSQIDSSMTLDMKVYTSQATNQPISEAAVNKAVEMAFATGGEPDTVIIKPADAKVIAGFAAATGRLRDLDPATKKLVNAVEVIVTPLGEVKFVIDRWIAPVDALVVDPGMWKLKVFRNWFTKQLAETGDARKSQILGEFGLAHRNFFADALITNLSTPA